MIKRFLRFTVFLLVSVSPVVAKPLPTNFVMSISLNLTFVGTNKTTASGSSLSNAVVTSKTAIAAFGSALGQKFSPKAQFLEWVPIGYYTNGAEVTGYAGNPVFVIKDGTNTYDITSFFTFSTLNLNGETIASAAINKQGVYTSYVSYRIRTIAINQGPITFSAQGFVKSPTIFLTVAPKILIYAYDDNWTSVTGTGTLGNESGVFQGTITATCTGLQ